MSEMRLYIGSGVAIRESVMRSGNQITVEHMSFTYTARSQDEAHDWASGALMQAYPVKDGYGHHNVRMDTIADADIRACLESLGDGWRDRAAAQARDAGYALLVKEYRAAFQADEDYRKAVRNVLDLSAGPTDELVAVANDLGAKSAQMRRAILAADPEARAAEIMAAREGKE